MIPFFRKIRYQLAKKNQFFNYSRYAFGEIVLVVIGILIALQINTWNEERKSNKLKKSYLENLIVDLNTDVKNLKEFNNINTAAEQEGQYLLAFFDNALVEIDTLRLTNSIIFCGFIPTSTIISATYNDIINSNKIQLFNDIELKRLLDDYYIDNEWTTLFNNRILQTAWYDYRDEMTKFHSPQLYKDFYAFDNSVTLNYSSKYDIKWDHIKNNDYIKRQIGMIDAYRLIIRNELEKKIEKAKALLTYLEKLK